jgi:site-specific DNA-methyltransferase (adenine-specific)
LVFSSDAPFIRLYHGNSLELLDAIAAKYPEGRFDCIFADPPYFLSNGGITCHAGKMVKVDKGDWDKSRGPELNHEFNLEWLRRCQRVLKPNGTLWVSGTLHVIFSIGYALQQLGYKILNDITWEKPNPPPNLSCRYFTHSTETVIWAAKNEKSKHVFNYAEMRKVTGKQMKTVWRKAEFPLECADLSALSAGDLSPSNAEGASGFPAQAAERGPALATSRQSGESGDKSPHSTSIWTLPAPGGDEKVFGKHPTQKPVALIERCLLAATNEGDLVLDPFLGGGTTAVAAVRIKRGCVGVELDVAHFALAVRRTDREAVLIWLREFRVNFAVAIFLQNDLDPDTPPMDRISGVKDGEPKADCIFHETKFVFISCAAVSSASVVHTTVESSLQEAWAKTPNGKKRETTHIVRCQTEILRVKP